jgi:glycosyltransferase involved in cell wall biosynthesis
VVAAAAALIPVKGISYLLQAAGVFLKTHPKTIVLVAGDGPLLETLKEEAALLGIEENVRFLGLISNVDQLMAVADVVVVPSVWQEPAGLVVIEGMASGRPVVATRVGGIPEYIKDGVTGILVERRSAQQIADAVGQLLAFSERAQEMGRAARRAAKTEFSTARWVAETLESYAMAPHTERSLALALPK